MTNEEKYDEVLKWYIDGLVRRNILFIWTDESNPNTKFFEVPYKPGYVKLIIVKEIDCYETF